MNNFYRAIFSLSLVLALAAPSRADTTETPFKIDTKIAVGEKQIKFYYSEKEDALRAILYGIEPTKYQDSHYRFLVQVFTPEGTLLGESLGMCSKVQATQKVMLFKKIKAKDLSVANKFTLQISKCEK